MTKKPHKLADPKFAARFKALYVDEGLSLKQTAERLGCDIKAARRVRDYLSLEVRAHGRPANPDNDEWREYVPPRCPWPNLPLKRGAFRNFDYDDVALADRLAGIRRAA